MPSDVLPEMPATTEPTSQYLTILDPPDHRPVPSGFWSTLDDLIEEAEWDELDEIERRVEAMAAYMGKLGTNRVEIEKARRVVEKRKGELLGPARQGARTDLQPSPRVVEVNASPATCDRWRAIAAGWDAIRDHLLHAQRVSDVTQAAILRLIQKAQPNGPKPEPTEPDIPEDDDHEPDPIAEWERAEKELAVARRQIEELSASDTGAEMRKLQQQIERLNGRLNAAITEAGEYRKQAKRQTDLLRKIMKALGVDSYGEIMGAVEAR